MDNPNNPPAGRQRHAHRDPAHTLRCKVCELDLPLSSYRPKRRTCTKCQRRADAVRLRTLQPVKYLLKAAAQRARDSGRAFNLEPSDIRIPTHCPLLGILIESADGFQTPNSPSLDRIDNAQGYVKGNVAVISWLANNLKGTRSCEALLAIAQQLAANLPAYIAQRQPPS